LALKLGSRLKLVCHFNQLLCSKIAWYWQTGICLNNSKRCVHHLTNFVKAGCLADLSSPSVEKKREEKSKNPTPYGFELKKGQG